MIAWLLAVALAVQPDPRALTAPVPVFAGIVHDAAGGIVSGATVIARTPAGSEQRTVTGPDGRFTIALAPPFQLAVLAAGFAEKKISISAATTEPLEVVVSPAGIQEEVTVTATRGEQKSGDVPASVNVLDRAEIRESPAVVADDVLKQLPTFSLFTRLGSLGAHPTSQGVSLRGIGPSGVSRTLVLLDGIPFNDPFGGWVYWTRIPLESTERIEVVDGSSSSLYGNYAMGGVINILTAQPARRTIEFDSQYGSLNSPKVDFRASDVYGKLGVAVDGSAFSTDGFPEVSASERGPVDNNTDVKFQNVGVFANYAARHWLNLFMRAGYFHERRDNGKITAGIPGIPAVEEGNNTTWKTASFGGRAELADGSDLQATLFIDNERFFSNFLAVPTPPAGQPARSIARVSLDQNVPATSVGATAQWSRAFVGRQLVSAGFDWRRVAGESQETALDPTKGITPTTARFSGGDQQLGGAFVQDVIAPTPTLELTLSARYDHWRNYDAHNLETTIATGAPTANNRTSCSAPSPTTPCLADRTDSVGSPRVAALYHILPRVSVWGDYAGGFRAPTLNELYRQFSKGAVTTKPNDQLGPERSKSGELGVAVEPVDNVSVRVTWFDNRIKDPVSNVSQNAAQTLIMRKNLGRTRISGLQTDVDYRLGQYWKFSAGYLYDQAKVVEFTVNPALGLPSIVGNYLPQVPKSRGTVRVSYSNPKYVTATVTVVSAGRQFNDDQNLQCVPEAALAGGGYPSALIAGGGCTPGLPKFTTVDLMAARDIGRGVQVYVSAQNVFNRELFTALLPTTIGPPRMVSGGFRIRWHAH